MHNAYLIITCLLLFQQQTVQQAHLTHRLRLSALQNCTYYAGDFWETVTLRGGQYHRRVEGLDCTLKLISHSWGDLDADGRDDALVILEGWCGGNGVDLFLVPVLNRNGKPVPLKGVVLSVEGQIRALNVRKGIVTLVSGNEKRFTVRYRLVGDTIEELE